MSYFKRCQANGVNMTPTTKQRVNFIYSTTDSWPRYNPVSPVVRLYAHRFVCIIVCTHTTKFIVSGVHYVVRMQPQPNCATWWSSKAKATVRETQHHMSAEWECRYARIWNKQTNNIYAKRKGCQMSLFKYMMEINMLQVIFKIISRESKETDWTSI